METEDGVLVIRRIHVRYRLRTSEDHHEAARRAHDVHHMKCPVYRTLHRCIEITTDLVFEAES